MWTGYISEGLDWFLMEHGWSTYLRVEVKVVNDKGKVVGYAAEEKRRGGGGSSSDPGL
jgi:hypothetical protein